MLIFPYSAGQNFPGSYLHLGMIGIVPKLKRLDVALDILQNVRNSDDRYSLFIKTKMPWEYGWVWKNSEERRYIRECLRRIQTDPRLRGSVTFDPFGGDVASWLRNIGIVLSTSDIEGSHVSVAEGMASGSASVVLPWAGADEVYGRPWVVNDDQAAVQRILEMSGKEVWEEQRKAASAHASRYDIEKLFHEWTTILIEDRDPSKWC